jgi:hypothetical protein
LVVAVDCFLLGTTYWQANHWRAMWAIERNTLLSWLAVWLGTQLGLVGCLAFGLKYWSGNGAGPSPPR